MVLFFIVMTIRWTVYLWLFCIYFCVLLAMDRNISRLVGLGVGILLGPVGLLVMWFLPERHTPERRRLVAKTPAHVPQRHERKRATAFHIHAKGRSRGTLTLEEIEADLDTGDLNLSDYYWNTEMGQWFVLSTHPILWEKANASSPRG